jgi:hypothetical protein
MRSTSIAIVAFLVLLGLALAVAPAARPDLAEGHLPVRVASTSADEAVPLADILSGRYQPGFFPALDGVARVSPRRGRVVWLRVVAAGGSQDTETTGGFLRFDRVPVQGLSLFLADDPATARAEALAVRPVGAPAQPESFVLALPAGITPETPLYVRVEGTVDAELRPQWVDAEGLAARQSAALRVFVVVYGLFAAALVLSLLKPVRRAGGGGGSMAVISALALLLVVLGSDHLPDLARTELMPWLGLGLVDAATVLLCGALLIVARHQSGLKSQAPSLAAAYHRGGLLLMALGFATAYVPGMQGDLMHRLAELVWPQVWLLVLVAFAIDRRRLRAVPITFSILMLVALVLRALAMNGVIPPVPLALYGDLVLLAAFLPALVLLPWVRERLGVVRRVPPRGPEVSTAEQWAVAELRLIGSIRSALQYGTLGEADGVVARRLVDTLTPLIEARSIAIVRSALQGGEQVVADPASSEAGYLALVRERGRMLRSVLRIGSPQQLVLPVGSGGSSQLAVVPYQISDAGWTALVVERKAKGFDGEELRRLESMVAAAREAVAVASEERKAAVLADRDAALDVLGSEALQRDMRLAFERCRDGGLPIALLRIPLSGEGGVDERAKTVIGVLEGLDARPHHLLGRPAPRELWLVLPGLDVQAARAFAERIIERLSPPLPAISGLMPAGTRPRVPEWAIGLAAIAPGERVPRPMIERAGAALERARVPGAQPIQVGVAEVA